MACVVVLATALWLMLPAISMTRESAETEVAVVNTQASASTSSEDMPGEVGTESSDTEDPDLDESEALVIASEEASIASKGEPSSEDTADDSADAESTPAIQDDADGVDATPDDDTIATDSTDANDEAHADADAVAEGGESQKPPVTDKPQETPQSADRQKHNDVKESASSGKGADVAKDEDSGDAESKPDEDEESTAQTFQAEVLDENGDVALRVMVDAPVGAFELGTTMNVEPVEPAAIQKAVDKAVAKSAEGTVQDIQAVDITFYDADGNEVEPAKDVTVRFTSDMIADNDNPLIVHVDDKGKATLVDTLTKKELMKRGDTPENNELYFEVADFSTYCIVSTTIEKTVLASDGQNYRVTATYGPESSIPASAALDVTEVTEGLLVDGKDYQQYIAQVESALGLREGSVGYIRLFDIKIVDKSDSGIKYQPADGSSVDVRIELADSQGKELSVVHFADEGSDGDVLESATDGQAVEFAADGFSVYAVVDPDDNAHKIRVKYVFQNVDGSPYTFKNTAGQTVDNQIIKDGESLENVGIPSINANGQTFNGWYIYDADSENLTGEQIVFDKAIGVDGGNSDTNITGTSVYISSSDNRSTDDEAIPDYTITVRPSFGEVSYITFWNETDGKVIYTKIQVPKGATYNIANQSAVPPDAITTKDPKTGEEIITPVSYAFTGWSNDAGTMETSGHPDTRTAIADTVITVNEDMEFYPIFRLSHWVSFYTAPVGSGATYYSPVYILSGNTAASARPATTPVWEGHTFVGWFDTEDDDYLSVGETAAGAWNFNQTLDDDVTLYAHWNAGTANVTIIRWLQQVTDDKNFTDTQKNYEYGGQVNQTVAVNSTVYPVNFDDVEGYMINSAKSDESVVVQADGTSVLNVYYDRKLMTMVFNGLGNQQGTYYTETTNNNGTQYGYVNGQYVQLTRGNAQTTYYWTYDTGGWNSQRVVYEGTRYTRTRVNYQYVYTPTTLETGTQYGQVGTDRWGNLQYAELTRRENTVYPWTYVDGNGKTQTYTGPRYTQTTSNNTTVYTGLYGQSLEQNGYTWPAGTWQYTSGGSSTGMSYLGQFIFPIPGSTIRFTSTSDNTKEIRFYLQNVDGTYPDEASDTGYVTNSSNSRFQFSEKYDGFTVRQYRLGNGDWQSAAVDGTVAYGQNTILHIRYERLNYNVKFLDSRNGTELADVATKSMAYGADLASANPNVTTLTPPTSQYVWDGHWYTDQDCTTIALFSDDTSTAGELGEYTSIDTEDRTVTYGTGANAKTYNYQVLGTMPNHDISVYAGWNEMWYWVKVDSNGGVLSDTESTWFWKTLGDKIDEYHDTTRQYIEDPNGEWFYHYDELNAETELNQYDTNVRKAYYFKADGTGLPEGVTLPAGGAEAWSYDGKRYCPDSKAYSLVGWYEVDQDTNQLKGLYNFNGGISGNTVIRAVWRTVGEYTVKYGTDAVDYNGEPELGTDGEPIVLQDGTVPTDISKYADKSNSSIGHAPSIIPEGYIFVGWYYDGAIYNPGDAFMVKAELADTDKQVWLYPVVVRYEQLPVHTTHIHWYANYEDRHGNQINEQTESNQPKDTTRYDPVQINASTDIIDIGSLLNGSDAYAGYTFLGWAKTQNATEPWLKLESDGTYSMQDGGSTVTGITKIAADENLPYDDMYAVWEKKTYTVTVRKVVESYIPADQNYPFTFTPNIDASELPTEYQMNFTLTGEETTVTPDSGAPITYYSQKVFEDIPYGTSVSFTEGSYGDFSLTSVKYTVSDADDAAKNVVDQNSVNGGELTVEGDVIITFTNTRKVASITLNKVAKGTSTLIPGAQFKLFKKTDEGIYASDEGIDATKAASVHVLADGTLTIEGLPSGDYRLEEVEAPAGYIIDSKEIYFTVNASGVGDVITATAGREAYDSDDVGVYTKGTDNDILVISNTPGKALPSTGGMGVAGIYILGGMLMMLAFALMLRRHHLKTTRV